MNEIKNKFKIINFSEKLILLRAWEKSNLPIEQSALALDLFLVIAHNTLRDQPLTLKQLFNSVDFSEAGIRKHLKRLLAEGWCSLEGSAKDKRLRHVVAQAKMLAALDRYTEAMRNTVESLDQEDTTPA
jgi:DNA-binding MarR family transcriptional regulator